MADAKSWNLWHGCRKWSEGCANCYMFALDRLHGVPERSAAVVRTGDLEKPLRRDRRGRFKFPAGFCLRVNMTSDTFLEEADPWRKDMWSVIRRRPDLVFLLLTKRVHRIGACLPAGWGEGWENVDLGMTCENQRAFEERWPLFSRVPARHKWINVAPCLGPVDLGPALASGQIGRVCLGGESFGGRRPCRHEWVERISLDCRRHGVSFTFNATGTVYVKDGEAFLLRRKEDQISQAFLSGLSHIQRFRPCALRDPLDRHVLCSWELARPVFSACRCTLCPSLGLCPGCAPCRRCGGEGFLDLEGILRLRRERLETSAAACRAALRSYHGIDDSTRS